MPPTDDRPAEPGSVRIERTATLTDPEQVGPLADAVRAQALPFLQRGYRVLEDLTATQLEEGPDSLTVRVHVVLHPTKGHRPILDRWRPQP